MPPRQITFLAYRLLLTPGCAFPLLRVASPTPSSNPATLQLIIAQTAAAAQNATLLALPLTATFTLTPSPTRIPTQTFTASPTFLFVFKTSTSFADATASAQYATEDAEFYTLSSDAPTPRPWLAK